MGNAPAARASLGCIGLADLFEDDTGLMALVFQCIFQTIADGFPPDTISSDMYAAHLGRAPRHDLPRVISKLVDAGLPERDAFAAATVRPAAVLGLAGEVGTLAPGACADLAVLRQSEGIWQAVRTFRAGLVC